MKNYPYKYYKKLSEIYEKLADLVKYAEQIEMNKDILLEEYVKEAKQEIIKKLGNLRYQLKEMGIELKFRLKGEFWNEKDN
jgi:protein subunit release factor A